MRGCRNRALGPPLIRWGTQMCWSTVHVQSFSIIFCLSNYHFCLPNFETLGGFLFNSSVFSWENRTSCQSWECQIARNNISPWIEYETVAILLWSIAFEAMQVKVGWKSLCGPRVCISWQLIIYLKHWQSRPWFLLTTISLFLDSQENAGLCACRQNNLVFLWTRAITYHHMENFSETKQVY